MAERLSDEEILYIIQLVEEGKTTREISLITKRSTTTIERMRKKSDYAYREVVKNQHDQTARWLRANWHWKTPEKQRIRKKRSSNFRTPYHYPGKAHF